jgi:hypothetical protein
MPSIILYEYQPTRNGDHAVEFLEGFSGYHQCDGFSGSNKLENVTRVACLAHLRRKFMEAIPKNKPANIRTSAEEGVLFCNELFELEREIKDLSPEERYNKRLKQSKPVLDAFWSWIDEQNPPGVQTFTKQ